MQFDIQLFNIFKLDEDCWGIKLLTIGMMGRSLFSIDADEDGIYLGLLWFSEIKIKNKIPAI